MGAFWFVAGMLTMFAALLVILPWLRTIPRFESLPALPWQVPLIGLIVVGAALSMYAWLGRPELAAHSADVMPKDSATAAMTASSTAVAGNGAAAGSAAGAGVAAGAGAAAGSMNAAVASLRARLSKGSGSADDWELLAKSYEFLGKPDEAKQARAHKLPPSDAASPELVATPVATTVAPTVELTPDSLKSLAKATQARASKQYAAAAKIYKQLAAAKQMNSDAWADYADTAATLQNNKLAGEPEIFIANALALNAANPKALWLQASAAEEAGRYSEALTAWERLQSVLPPDSQDAKIVADNLQRDRELAGAARDSKPGGAAMVSGAAVAGGAATVSGAAAGGTRISGEVSVASTLSGRATPGATLFIVAKSVDAPGPPVAVFRGSVGAWPVKFTLDDSSSMLPGRTLSNAKRVTVEARISRSGQALPAAGDLRGTTGVIDPLSRQPLKIVINEVVS